MDPEPKGADPKDPAEAMPENTTSTFQRPSWVPPRPSSTSDSTPRVNTGELQRPPV
ncbi:MAG: hypothetical protein K1Y01_02505 [Vicinamibacteria bacterium]|nr:hypothetical protein [Vicinamibacteria bacterium]